MEIVVRNWPDSNIVRSVGEGLSRMTEEDLFDARKQGLNMPVNVDGTYFLPPNGGLMSDGSAYGSGHFVPIGVVGKRYVRGVVAEKWIGNHQLLITALDPDDPRPSWAMAAA